MSDPADKSDDLIAELAKLMAASPGGNQPIVAPVARAVPAQPQVQSPQAASVPPQAPPIRIPGMDQPRPTNAAAPTVAARAPVTGAIRIPGMDSPAPVATSAPVSKFDFGARPATATPIKQEPLSTLTERLAASSPRVEPDLGSNPASRPAPIRIPSDLRPVSENRSFAQGPTLSVAPPAPQPAPPPRPVAAAPEADTGDFSFDFGFGRNPPPSDSPPRPTQGESDFDPIADLIAAEFDDPEDDSADEVDEPAPAPVARTSVAPQQVPPKQLMVPVAPSRPAGSQPVPLKPISVAPRAPEADRFARAPGAGIAMAPPATQALALPMQRAPLPVAPTIDSDPMSEIESLIGDAVRVELAPPGPIRVQSVQQKIAPHVEIRSDFDLNEDGDLDEIMPPKPSAAPIVPPLNTSFAPRRAGLKDEPAPSGAEDAILAAVAAGGARVDQIEPSVGDDSPYRRLKVKPARSFMASGGMRQYVGMAVAGTLLLASGLGLYWVLNLGRANSLATDAPQLTADATPVKEVPEATAVPETDAARSPVLGQMAGASTEPRAEQLVSTDETALAPVTRDVTNAADTESGLANRKVRTVTVRPDGTIVSGDDAVAGAEELPVDRPNVPVVPVTDTTNLLGDSTAVAMTDPATENTSLSTQPEPLTATTDVATSTVTPVFNPSLIAPTPISFPVRSERTTALVADTPASTPVAADTGGASTPAGQIDLLGGQIPAPSSPAQANSGNAAAYVQLSSSPSQADAQASLRSLNNKFGSLFGGNELVVQSADLGQKGTWYRVKLPAASLADAQGACARIKANGGDCIVTGG